MLKRNFLKAVLNFPLKLLNHDKSYPPNGVEGKNSILIIWCSDGQGFILSGRNLIVALKKTLPESNLTLLVKSENVNFLSEYRIRETLGLNENDIIAGNQEFYRILRTKFDITVVVTIDKFRFQDHFLVWLSGAQKIIGISFLNDKNNIYKFILDQSVEIRWKNYPDSHFTEVLLKLFLHIKDEISLSYSNISFFKMSDSERKDVHAEYEIPDGCKLIGLNFDTARISDRWSAAKIIDLIDKFLGKYNSFFYFLSSGNYDDFLQVVKNFDKKTILIPNDNYYELLKIISISDLFITVESDIMHLAGLSNVRQISLFGDSNPFQWAPIGEFKRFIHKKDLIEDISVDDIINLTQDLIQSKI